MKMIVDLVVVDVYGPILFVLDLILIAVNIVIYRAKMDATGVIISVMGVILVNHLQNHLLDPR